MNEKLEPWNDPKVEALVVAAILGEASDFEMAEVERLCQEHPEMALFFERMRNLHRYLDEIHDREEKEEDAWQLPKDKREALLNKIQTESEPTSRPVHQSNQSQGRKKSRRRVRALMMVAACLVVTMFTALLFIPAGEPALYESETKLQVLVSASDIDPFAANGRQQGLAKSKEFLPTEFKKITSEENLLRVVDRLDLKTRWGIDRQSAMEILKGATDLNADSDSDVVGIKVRHGNAEDARDIANEIANQYVERRKALEAGRAEKSLLAIDSELPSTSMGRPTLETMVSCKNRWLVEKT